MWRGWGCNRPVAGGAVGMAHRHLLPLVGIHVSSLPPDWPRPRPIPPRMARRVHRANVVIATERGTTSAVVGPCHLVDCDVRGHGVLVGNVCEGNVQGYASRVHTSRRCSVGGRDVSGKRLQGGDAGRVGVA